MSVADDLPRVRFFGTEGSRFDLHLGEDDTGTVSMAFAGDIRYDASGDSYEGWVYLGTPGKVRAIPVQLCHCTGHCSCWYCSKPSDPRSNDARRLRPDQKRLVAFARDADGLWWSDALILVAYSNGLTRDLDQAPRKHATYAMPLVFRGPSDLSRVTVIHVPRRPPAEAMPPDGGTSPIAHAALEQRAVSEFAHVLGWAARGERWAGRPATAQAATAGVPGSYSLRDRVAEARARERHETNDGLPPAFDARTPIGASNLAALAAEAGRLRKRHLVSGHPGPRLRLYDRRGAAGSLLSMVDGGEEARYLVELLTGEPAVASPPPGEPPPPRHPQPLLDILALWDGEGITPEQLLETVVRFERDRTGSTGAAIDWIVANARLEDTDHGWFAPEHLPPGALLPVLDRDHLEHRAAGVDFILAGRDFSDWHTGSTEMEDFTATRERIMRDLRQTWREETPSASTDGPSGSSSTRS